MWCEFEREVNKQPHKHPGLSQGQDLRGNDHIDREVVILTCQRFWSQMEAVVEASGDLINQMCM
jgi:hypothetical protein